MLEMVDGVGKETFGADGGCDDGILCHGKDPLLNWRKMNNEHTVI